MIVKIYDKDTWRQVGEISLEEVESGGWTYEEFAEYQTMTNREVVCVEGGDGKDVSD